MGTHVKGSGGIVKFRMGWDLDLRGCEEAGWGGLDQGASMRLTKPAGVGFQLVGALLVLVGLGSLQQSIVWGVITLAVGGWMFWQGRQPAKR